MADRERHNSTLRRYSSLNTLRTADETEEAEKDGSIRAVSAKSGLREHSTSRQHAEANYVNKSTESCFIQDKDNGRQTDSQGELTTQNGISGSDCEDDALSLEERQDDIDDMELKYYFDEMDTDKSGLVSMSEMKKFAQLCGVDLTDAEVAEEMKGVDMDGNRRLDFEEYKHIYHTNIKQSKPKMEGTLSEAVDVFLSTSIKSQDGQIDKEELREYLKNKGDDRLTDEEFDELFRDMGHEDRVIDKRDFCRMLRS